MLGVKVCLFYETSFKKVPFFCFLITQAVVYCGFIANLNLFRNCVLPMKTLLCTLNSKYIHTNLAIRILYEINSDNKDLYWKEFTIKEDKDEIVNYCLNYELIAFSCYIWNISHTLLVAEKIKSLNPEIKILLGGPEVSYEFEEVISKPFIDFIIQGEGEIPFSEFLKTYPNFSLVPSLIYKLNDQVISNRPSPNYDVSLFENTMPYRTDNAAELKNKVLYIETSRGCPYKCEFCLASLDNKVRYLPDKHIKSTLLYLMQNGKVIKFLDRTFNVKRDFTLDIFQFILDHHQQGNIFQFEITADILHPDIISFIKEKVPRGLFRFEIGIQTVNQKANLEVSRKQNFEKTKEIILDLKDYLEMHLDLIVGLPLDYWEDIQHSFDEVFALRAPELQLGFLKFLKGTPVRNKYKEHGFEFDKEAPYQIIKSKYLSEEQLKKIVELEHALEVYWNDGRALNTLNYIISKVSPFEFLMGLGIYFGETKNHFDFTLTDIFEVLSGYCKNNYPGDNALQELVAIDYYLHYKVKPKQLFLPEIEKKLKTKVTEGLKLNHHKNRYVILQLSFSFGALVRDGRLEYGHNLLILEYNGIDKAKIFQEVSEGAFKK